MYAEDLFIFNIGGNGAKIKLELPYEDCNQYNHFCQGPECGDEILTENELCEKSFGYSELCDFMGFDDGTAKCNSDCVGITYNCFNYTYAPECGNNYREGSEQCDEDDLGYTDVMNVSLQIQNPITVTFNGKEYKLEYLGGNSQDKTIILKVNSETRTLEAHENRMLSGIIVSYDIFSPEIVMLTLKANPISCEDLNYGEGELGCTGICTYNITRCEEMINRSNCTDSDNGINIFVAGETYIRHSGGGSGMYDSCDFSLGHNNVLLEGICENNNPKRINITCPTQTPYCNKAVCSINPPTCIDTDDGMDITIKGTVIESRFKEGPENTDYCEYISNKQPAENGCIGSDCGVREYTCSSPISTTFIDVPCPLGCQNGACTNKTTNKTLGDYPAIFFNNGAFVGSVVVGANSAASDIIGSNDVVASLQRFAGNNPLLVGIVKLDSQITDISSRKLIVVGGPCANTVATQLLGNPYDCTMGLRDGEAIIQLIDRQNVQYVLAYGYSGEDTQMATRVLAYWQDYRSVLRDATKVCVTGTLSSISATKC